jgi:hypothetical protein
MCDLFDVDAWNDLLSMGMIVERDVDMMAVVVGYV